jgi:hypothetical protein
VYLYKLVQCWYLEHNVSVTVVLGLRGLWSLRMTVSQLSACSFIHSEVIHSGHHRSPLGTSQLKVAIMSLGGNSHREVFPGPVCR